MAILFRNISDLTIGGMTARLTVYSGSKDLIRVEIAPYAASSSAVYSGTLNVDVTYNGETKNLTTAPFTKTVSAVFRSVGWTQTIAVSSGAAIVYGGNAVSPLTVSWKGDGSVPVPELELTYSTGLRVGMSSRIEWAVKDVPEGYRAYTIGVWYHFAPKTQIAPAYTRTCVIDRKTLDFCYDHNISGLEEKNVVFYRIAVGLYPENGADPAARDDYVLYLELDTPAYVCSGSTVYTIAPYALRWSGPKKNRVVTLTWETFPWATETKGFILHYTTSGDTWYQLFWNTCASKSYSFAVPQGTSKIAFRICSYSTRSKYEQSGYTYTPWIPVGGSNIYVGHGGSIVPAAEVHIGSAAANASLNVG